MSPHPRDAPTQGTGGPVWVTAERWATRPTVYRLACACGWSEPAPGRLWWWRLTGHLQECPGGGAPPVSAHQQRELELVASILAGNGPALPRRADRPEGYNRAPFGWRAGAGGPVPDPAEQAAAARMIELRAAGAGSAAIARALEAEGHRPRGRRWQASSVARILARLDREGARAGG
jgi:hypothetical protein